jgi:hypothetical protein
MNDQIQEADPVDNTADELWGTITPWEQVFEIAGHISHFGCHKVFLDRLYDLSKEQISKESQHEA